MISYADCKITDFILTQGNAVEIKLSYEYDPAGRVTAVSDRGIRTEYTYDPLSRIKTVVEENGSK